MIRLPLDTRPINTRTGAFLADQRPDQAPNRLEAPRDQGGSRSGRRSGDAVMLSDEAKSLLSPDATASPNGNAPGRVPPDGLTVEIDDTTKPGDLERLKAMLPDFDPRKFTSEYLGAESAYQARMSDYLSKRGELVAEKLGAAVSWTGGAGHGVLERFAAEQGLEKPRPDRVMLDAGWTDPLEKDAGSQTGILGMGSPGSDHSLAIAFDRNAVSTPDTATSDTMTLVRLTGRKNETASTTALVASGPLAKLTDLRDSAGGVTYAVTNGKSGPDTAVFATVSSHGMDEKAEAFAVPLLKALQRHLTNAPR